MDISAPGYDTSERIKTTLTRGDKGGQKGEADVTPGLGIRFTCSRSTGIISALSFSTDYSGLYAAGSFGGSVSLYSEDESGAVGHLDGIEGGGVTQVRPGCPNMLDLADIDSSHSTLLPQITFSSPRADLPYCRYSTFEILLNLSILSLVQRAQTSAWLSTWIRGAGGWLSGMSPGR